MYKTRVRVLEGTNSPKINESTNPGRPRRSRHDKHRRSKRNSVVFQADPSRKREFQPAYFYDERTIHSLSYRSKEFSSLLDSGKYVFYDGYVCLKSPDCFQIVNGETVFQKSYVESHLSEYCIAYNSWDLLHIGRVFRFRYASPSRKREIPFTGIVRNASKEDEVISEEEKREFIAFAFGGGDDSFSEYLVELLNNKVKITQTELSNRTGISTKTIQSMTRNKKPSKPMMPRKYKLNYVVACAIALHLDPFQSDQFIKLSGHQLRCDEPLERAYQRLLNIYWRRSVYDCNLILEEQGFPAMTNNENIYSYK